jgi:hypothetical protein
MNFKSGRYSGFYEDSAQGRSLASVLLPNPDKLFATGEPVHSAWQSARTDKAVIRLGGQRYFLKRYNCLGFGYRIKNLFRPSRALRSWHNGLSFQRAQVPTVPPVLCLEERVFSSLGRSYVAFAHLEDAVSLLDGWRGLPLQEKTDSLLSLAGIFARMHRKGIYHGDLNWRNILLREDDGERQLLLIDLDGCRYRRGYREKLAIRDLRHFYRDMQRVAVPESLTLVFRQAWRSAVED